MGWFFWNRRPEPVPLAPRHRRVWHGLHRRCSCGLAWRSCPDRYASVPTEPTRPLKPNKPNKPAVPAVPAEPLGNAPTSADRSRFNRPLWTDATVAIPQVGRTGWLTRAQTYRANGGRW